MARNFEPRVARVGSPAGRSAPTFEEVLQRRVSRRAVLKAGLVASAAAVPWAAGARPALGRKPQRRWAPGELRFDPIEPETSDFVVVADGHRSTNLISWGDPLFPGVGPFDFDNQDPDEAELRHGFNCDFLMFLPLPSGSQNPNRGLLWVNHEYTDGFMMFAGYDSDNPTEEEVGVELAAHGASVIEVVRTSDGTWAYDVNSSFNRRITARSTPIRLSGPAAGDERLQTAGDPTGTLVTGMLNQCGGGITPWGTVLAAEENWHQYFAFDDGTQARYGAPEEESDRKWERFVERFDLREHPNEINRFGWMVEVDPHDPEFIPVKRTALGRFKHEACTLVVAPGDRIVAYSGDDERFDYIYRFVSDEPFDRTNRGANLGLLDRGTLFVARFDADGTGEWLPLVFGDGPLTPANGFVSQADVLIRTREAADALGATPMDRPEDVETNPVNGKVYVALTNNTRREEADAPNPRAPNPFGHVLEIDDRVGPGGLTGTGFAWEIFLLCGDPDDPSTFFAGFPPEEVSPISSPDNLEFDRTGNLWIATDGQPSLLGHNDAVHAVPTEGDFRGQVKQFFSAVPAAECASLKFTPNDSTLFVSIQHPGEGGTLAEPTSLFPNNAAGGPAQPTVVAVTRERGRGPIGR